MALNPRTVPGPTVPNFHVKPLSAEPKRGASPPYARCWPPCSYTHLWFYYWSFNLLYFKLYEPELQTSVGRTEAWRVASLCAVLAAIFLNAQAAPAQLCAGAAEDDPRAARFCQALNTFLELYAEAAGEQVPEYQGECC